MKKFIISISVFITICSCCTNKSNTITWEEACELSWAYYLEKNNYPDLPWEEQSDSVQNDYLDCWAGSAEEDSLLMQYTIIY